MSRLLPGQQTLQHHGGLRHPPFPHPIPSHKSPFTAEDRLRLGRSHAGEQKAQPVHGVSYAPLTQRAQPRKPSPRRRRLPQMHRSARRSPLLPRLHCSARRRPFLHFPNNRARRHPFELICVGASMDRTLCADKISTDIYGHNCGLPTHTAGWVA